MNAVESRHLADDRLAACYLSEGDPEHRLPAEVEALAHLEQCETCARRYALVGSRLAELREDDDPALRALVAPEHLEAQRAQILRRLEHLGQQARVLSFQPKAGGVRPGLPARPAARWVAAAAAAGLVVGLGLGSLSDWQIGTPWTPAEVSVRSIEPSTVSEPASSVAASTNMDDALSNDEALLSEIEQALARQRAAELQALDALTPSVRDIAERR